LGEKYIAIMIGECERKKLLERPRRRWNDNIKMYVREMACEFGSGQRQMVGSDVNRKECPGSIKCKEYSKQLSNCESLKTCQGSDNKDSVHGTQSPQADTVQVKRVGT
jgi:hypothetical protein